MADDQQQVWRPESILVMERLSDWPAGLRSAANQTRSA